MRSGLDPPQRIAAEAARRGALLQRCLARSSGTRNHSGTCAITLAGLVDRGKEVCSLLQAAPSGSGRRSARAPGHLCRVGQGGLHGHEGTMTASGSRSATASGRRNSAASDENSASHESRSGSRGAAVADGEVRRGRKEGLRVAAGSHPMRARRVSEGPVPPPTPGACASAASATDIRREHLRAKSQGFQAVRPPSTPIRRGDRAQSLEGRWRANAALGAQTMGPLTYGASGSPRKVSACPLVRMA